MEIFILVVQCILAVYIGLGFSAIDSYAKDGNIFGVLATGFKMVTSTIILFLAF